MLDVKKYTASSLLLVHERGQCLWMRSIKTLPNISMSVFQGIGELETFFFFLTKVNGPESVIP